MHESQVKCIPFSGAGPRQRKYNYVLQGRSYLSLLHFPPPLQPFSLVQDEFTLRQVANAPLSRSKGPLSTSVTPKRGVSRLGVATVTQLSCFAAQRLGVLIPNYNLIEEHRAAP